MENETKQIKVGEWVEIYGVPFQVAEFILRTNEPPRLVLKHPLELMPKE